MRKAALASALGLALIAGQAIASNGAAQALATGDRVGASLGMREGLLPAFPRFSDVFAAQSWFELTFGIVIPLSILTKIVIDDVNLDDEDESPS